MHIKCKNICYPFGLWFWALLLSNCPFTNCNTIHNATANSFLFLRFFSTIVHAVLTPKENHRHWKAKQIPKNRTLWQWMNEQAKNEKNEKEESDLEGDDEGIVMTAHCTWMYLLRLEEKWNNSNKKNLMSHGYHCNAININDIMFDLKGFSSLFLPKIKRIEKLEQ